LKAKKSFGQHFLKDQVVIQKIIDAILVKNSKNVLEIGPGRAAITKSLLAKVDNLKAVEADRDMFEFLVKQFPNKKDVFIFQDVLKTKFEELFEGEEFLLCGNFPYNISSQIVFKTLENNRLVPEFLGMFQKEMAQRIVANPRTKDYGILSVLCALFFDREILFDIFPESFYPPPAVMSSFVYLKRKEHNIDENTFLKLKAFVKSSFQFRRKTLRNNLRTTKIPLKELEDDYFDKRPEEISPEEFLQLMNKFL
jgi:16S rRNA (adenine1518-N6/adenine1519-N6)-dimethyltransferase